MIQAGDAWDGNVLHGCAAKHKDMIHNMFGGNKHGEGSGWATLSKVSLLTGAATIPNTI